MSTPIIPPRLQQRTERIAAENDAAKLPEIPARPVSKRSISPANYSPLLEPYHLGRKKSIEPVQRPPSVSRFPTSGEEGMEYGEIQYQPVNPSSALAADAAAQTRNVASDLKLHAPKPSLPTTSATAQVQAVTRTDSTTAAAHGIGRSPSQDGEPLGRIRSRASFSRPDSAASGDRRRSVYADEHEHGPAGVGIRVPINPLLGDVQAPSPAPGLSPHHTGEKKRHHQRTKSGREVLPPGSYGLHGHGIASENKFERDWYAKHPDQLQHEEGQGHGVYESIGSGRGAFAMSSDDLNKIVRDTATRGHGFGTTGGVMSYPDEQIGYAASEQYQSRNATPTLHKVPTTEVSPTRKLSDPAEDSASPELSRTGTREDGSVVGPDNLHIDAPARKFNKITGGEGTLKDKDEVKPFASHPIGGDRSYTVPILADDEVAKELGHDALQPALSPSGHNHRRSGGYDDYEYGSPHTSRPSSRPGSIYQMHSASHSLTRFLSHHEGEHTHTPLEDVDEYEPLFPEDDSKKKDPITVAERFKKRPETLRHKFPSQDIWEDTPNSAMYEATVSTPDLPATEKSGFFEPPEVEAARKGEASEAEKKKLVPAEQQLAKSKFAPHLRDDMPTRPGMQPRFPSRDIWEDSPDSQYLVTTVNAPEEDSETNDEVGGKPTVPVRPLKSRLGDGASSAQMAPSVAPNVPARPEKRVHAVPPADAQLTDTSIPPGGLKKVPSIPDKPKPQIPARPSRKPDSETLSKVISGGSVESNEAESGVPSPPVTKAKPQVPARPAGNKIANLRSNFMNDLNQKLGLGPPKEKEAEVAVEPEEVKPLEDARKGRARGPQRRAPAKSPSSGAAQTSSFSISIPRTIFTIDHNDSLLVSTLKAQSRMSEDKITQMQHSTIADAPMPTTVDTTSNSEPSSKSDLGAEKADDDGPKTLAPSLATNTAGESVDPGAAPAEASLKLASEKKEDDVATADTPTKPMTESDVDYKRLEEMTASADGKGHATEEGTQVQ